jgi:acetolactate synthase regulatory subunit
MIQFGLRLHDAEKLPVEQVLPLVRQKGFTCAHVALSKSFKELPCTQLISKSSAPMLPISAKKLPKKPTSWL